jgi:hypothetical protein
VPFVFVAVTVYVYVPFTVSVTVTGLVPVAVTPEEEVTVYPVIADPPVAPAVNVTVTVPPETRDAVPIVGACGTVVAVIEDDALDAGPVALALVAVTANVYDVALCNPVTVKGEPAPDAVYDPGVDVAV